MDIQEQIERFTPFIKSHIIPLGLAILGAAFLIFGLMSFSQTSSSQNDLDFSLQSEKDTKSQPENSNHAKTITIDIEGGVSKPGVYELADNARVQDALIKSGGLTKEADRDWVGKNLNLSTKLSDGIKIYIPFIGEKISGLLQGQIVLININTASVQELDGLPGVGAATAQKIIAGRPYNNLQDLISLKIVSSSVFEKIKDKITVN